MVLTTTSPRRGVLVAVGGVTGAAGTAAAQREPERNERGLNIDAECETVTVTAPRLRDDCYVQVHLGRYGRWAGSQNFPLEAGRTVWNNTDAWGSSAVVRRAIVYDPDGVELLRDVPDC